MHYNFSTDADKIELVVMNPTMPLGPPILDAQQDVSHDIVQGWARGGGMLVKVRGAERDCCRKASRGDYSLGKWVTLEMLI